MRPALWIFSSLAAASVVRLDFDVTRGESFDTANKFNKRQLVRRDDAVEVSLLNEQSFYAVEIQIGEERQNITVQIDTGSADLWVMAASNPYCESSSGSRDSDLEGSKVRIGNRLVMREYADALDAYPSGWGALISSLLDETATASEPFVSATPTGLDAIATMDCEEFGTYDVDSSFQSNNTEFLIQYADYTYAYGEFGTDSVLVGGVTVDDLSFAVANQSNSSMGVLGIGLKETEATYMGSTLPENFTYENLPLRMVSQGLIPKNAYSLYLNPDNSSGTVLFGGVDHSMYSGTLQTVKVINQYASQGVTTPLSLDITLSSISYIPSQGSATNLTVQSYPAILDSGTTSMYAPEDVVEAMASSIGARYSESLGVYRTACSRFENQFFSFNFTGAELRVPVSELMIDISVEYAGECALGVFPQDDDSFVLGDSVMRSAYVVYDLENLEVSVAQAQRGASDSDIEVISSTVPSAVRAPQYSATWTGSDETSDPRDTESTSTASGSGSTSTARSGGSTAYFQKSPGFLVSGALLVVSLLLCM